MRLMLSMLRDAGCRVNCTDDSVRIRACDRLRGLGKIITAPYPGFPTDLQAPMCALACICEGSTVVVENLFETRFKHVPELIRMGADVTVRGRSAFIRGVKALHGADVFASDLRGGAALLVAALAADGLSVISDSGHLKRGYEDIGRDLRKLGADIEEDEL